MAKLKERGRQALAVGAGVMLIGTLTAGSALATSSYDEYDWDYYYSYDCGDYKYSSYYKYGYWYEKHPDRPGPDTPGEPPFELPDLGDLTPEQIAELIQDLIDRGLLPEGFELPDGATSVEDIEDAIRGGLQLPTSQVPVQGVTGQEDPAAARSADTPSDPAPESAEEVEKVEPAENVEPAAPKAPEEVETVDPPAKVETVDPPANVVADPAPPVVEVPTENKAAVTSLSDDPDYKDEDDKHKEGYYKYGEKKYSYTSYKCYENKEKKHRWYDHREPGKVTATAVRSVPKGGVDTGN